MQAPNYSIPSFTCQEVKILSLWSDGCTIQKMASELNISTFTVKKHRQNIVHKADVKGTEEIRAFIRDIAPHLKK
jgi:DNA-binding CsgD family transcriptional regulator